MDSSDSRDEGERGSSRTDGETGWTVGMTVMWRHGTALKVGMGMDSSDSSDVGDMELH